jgi:cytochrome c oxidase cbb3-type subunit 3
MSLRTVILIVTAFFAAGCERERREFSALPASAPQVWATPKTPLPVMPGSGPDIERNAYSLNQGKQLFSAFNCVGCHGHGGGGIAPALINAKWRYGSDAQHIFTSIMDGRPNGMPAFRGKLAEQQAWQIAGYVRSLSGLVSFSAAPGRDDHMKANPPSNSVDPVKPEPASGSPAP